MPIIYKGKQQIEMMRRAGAVVARVLAAMRRRARPSVTTLELDRVAAEELTRAGAISTSKNFPTFRQGEGFPGYTCINVNEAVVHGVPGTRVLEEGDVVSLDVGASLGGWCASAATTVPVGPVSQDVKQFLDVAAGAFKLALEQSRPGRKWSLVAGLIQRYVERHGAYGIVREFVGYGIGRMAMEEPQVPHFVDAATARRDFILQPGLTMAIMPILTMGGRDVVMCADQWTVATDDGLPAAYFKHTIAMTETGADVLTRLDA